MTDVLLEQQVTKLTFAVLLLDDYSIDNPSGHVNVTLKDRKETAIRNLNQYYLFLDLELPDAAYVLQTRSDHYLDTNLEFIVEQGNMVLIENNVKKPIDPKNPLIVIYLKPDTSYIFPNYATLIRGMLYDNSKNPVPDVRVDVLGSDIELNTITSQKGEFVLYFLPTIQKGIGINDNGYVEVNGNTKISLKFQNISKKFDINEIKEFETLSLQIIGENITIVT